MSRKTIAVVNGPNINILGLREPQFYGTETWQQIKEKLEVVAEQLNINIIFFQSNCEGKIVDFLQENMKTIDGVVINPAGYTKTGYAILDALTAINIPYIEVHLSNIVSRGSWHAESIFTCGAVGLIIGLKGLVYDLGIRAIVGYLSSK